MFAGGASEYRLTSIAALGDAPAPGLSDHVALSSLGMSQTDLVTMFFVCAGLAILAMPMALRWVRKLRQSPSAPPSVQSRADALSRVARDRESLETLMKDVRELTRLCAQQLDSRAERIEKLLEQADERIRRLEAASGTGREAPLVETKPASPTRTTKSASRLDSTRSSPPEFPQDPLARQVYELADQGRSPVEIAGSLEEHVGKVELILALRGA